MTQDDLDRLARKAGLYRSAELAIFAALVEAAERERNAALCEGARSVAEHSSRDGHKRAGAIAMASTCAMLIRGPDNRAEGQAA